MTVEMKPIAGSSSNIRAIGHDPEKRELHVRFDSGTYVYSDVDAEKHAALMAAPSKGAHLHANIKGKHTHRKLGD